MDYIDEKVVMARADELYNERKAGEIGIQSEQVKCVAKAIVEEVNAAICALATAVGVPR